MNDSYVFVWVLAMIVELARYLFGKQIKEESMRPDIALVLRQADSKLEIPPLPSKLANVLPEQSVPTLSRWGSVGILDSPQKLHSSIGQ